MTTETPTRMPRGGKLLLIASLAVNLIVAGVLIGAFVSHPEGGRPQGVGFGPYTSALAQEDREALRKAFGAHARANDFRARMQGDRTALAALLRAEPLDTGALAALFEEQRIRADEGFRMGQDLLLARIAAMTPDARKAFADRLERGPDHRREGKN